MTEKNYENIYNDIRDLDIMQLYEVAYETAGALANISNENGSHFISMEMFPMIGPVMYRKYYLGSGDDEEELSVDSIANEINTILKNGQYKEITHSAEYEIFKELTRTYVEDANKNNDRAQQVLAVLKDFSTEMLQVMETLRLNLDEDAFKGISSLYNAFVGRMEDFVNLNK